MAYGGMSVRVDRTAATDLPPRISRARHIWLCADDYGISTAVNAAIRDLVVRGRLNATSVMVVAPSFHRSEALSLAMLNAGAPRVAIGLHVTLTAPFRPLSGHSSRRATAPSCRSATTLARAFLRRLRPRCAGERDRGAAAAVRSHASAARPISSTATSTCTCSRRSATRCSRSPRQTAPRRLGAPVRPRGAAAAAACATARRCCSTSLSRSFRAPRAALGVRTNPAFAGTYDFNDDAEFRDAVPALPRPAAGRQRGHVPSGLRRCRIAAARSADHAARAGICLPRRTKAFPAVLATPRRRAGLDAARASACAAIAASRFPACRAAIPPRPVVPHMRRRCVRVWRP